MSKYFSYFPRDIHTNRVATDITKRVDFRKSIFADPYVYLPFLIGEEDRAEDVADLYYGDVRFTWLVWLSARVQDPYYEWPMMHENFLRYLQKKYAEESGTTGQAVIAWTQNTTIETNIKHYRNKVDKDLIISKDSYSLGISISSLNASEWEAVRYYTYEDELNDDRRTINLLDRRFANQAERELKQLLNG